MEHAHQQHHGHYWNKTNRDGTNWNGVWIDSGSTTLQGVESMPNVTDDFHMEILCPNIPPDESHQTLQQGQATRICHYRGDMRAHPERLRPGPEHQYQVSSLQCPIPMAIHHRLSDSTTSLTCSPIITADTSRPSTLSKPSGLTSPDGETIMLRSSSKPEPPQQKKYLCPKCNMGTGHYKRSYVIKAKEFTHGDENLQSADASDLRPRVIQRKNQWDDRHSFETHIREDHINEFKSFDSTTNEYVCTFCPCTVHSDSSMICGVRFTSEQAMINHLATSHAGGPRRLRKQLHFCDLVVIP